MSCASVNHRLKQARSRPLQQTPSYGVPAIAGAGSSRGDEYREAMRGLWDLAARWLDESGILAALEHTDSSGRLVRILSYQRVAELDAEPDLDPGRISATPAEFRAQMTLIARRYQAISLEAIVAAHRGEARLPPRSVLLAFHGGYEDFERHAWPVLQDLGLPATLFVPTSYPDSQKPGFWWDRLYAALLETRLPRLHVEPLGTFDLREARGRWLAHRALRSYLGTLPESLAMSWLEQQLRDLDAPGASGRHRVLGWQKLRRLARSGVSICSHGHHLAPYTRLPPVERAHDLAISKALIDEKLNIYAPPPVFAYPGYARSPLIREETARAGYVLALGPRRGIDRLPLANPLDLMQLPVSRPTQARFRIGLRPGIAAWSPKFATARAPAGMSA